MSVAAFQELTEQNAMLSRRCVELAVRIDGLMAENAALRKRAARDPAQSQGSDRADILSRHRDGALSGADRNDDPL